jgi:hypothetical protein
MPQPTAVTNAAEELIRVYTQAWETILAEQERLLGDPTRARRRARLRELRAVVEAELDALGAPTRSWLARRLPAIYAAGGPGMTWTTLHRSAVQQLATDTFNDLLVATRYVRQDVKRLVREAGKFLSEQTLTTGRTAQQSGRTLATFLRERGLAAITYRNGARHGLADYADTVLRSKTAVAYNTGTINTGVERGITVFEIFDGPGCGLEAHAVGPEANGMIVDANTAMAFPIAHPRCQRALAARPDLAPQQATRTRTSGTAALLTFAVAAAAPTRTERKPREPRRPRREPEPA